MSGARILVAGATGLIGEACVQHALAEPRVAEVIRLLRRSAGPAHPKLADRVTGEDLLSGLPTTPVDAVICCLGTTIHNVGGDQGRFIHVDKDLVVGLAQWAKDHGVRTFCVVSAMGADAGSRIFYNRVKGEMEEAVKALGIPRTVIMQPSILTGPRKEVRIGERIGIGLMNVVAPLLIGSARAYRPMPSVVLGRALVNAALAPEPGVHVLRYDAIRALAGDKG